MDSFVDSSEAKVELHGEGFPPRHPMSNSVLDEGDNVGCQKLIQDIVDLRRRS